MNSQGNLDSLVSLTDHKEGHICFPCSIHAVYAGEEGACQKQPALRGEASDRSPFSFFFSKLHSPSSRSNTHMHARR